MTGMTSDSTPDCGRPAATCNDSRRGLKFFQKKIGPPNHYHRSSFTGLMHLMAPMTMTQWKTKIVKHVAGGKSNRWIACETHHGHDVIQEIGDGLDSPMIF
jgi:hypothetical protein